MNYSGNIKLCSFLVNVVAFTCCLLEVSVFPLLMEAMAIHYFAWKFYNSRPRDNVSTSRGVILLEMNLHFFLIIKTLC